MTRPIDEQIATHHQPPRIRRASLPAQQTRAYRESVGTTAGTHREDVPYTTDERGRKRAGNSDGGTPLHLDTRKRPLSPAIEEEGNDEYEDDDYDDAYPPRLPSSARRYQTTRADIYTQGNKRLVVHREPPPTLSRGRSYWLLFLCSGMLLMALAWVGLTSVSNWWQTTQDDWHYGRPRTFQCDATVGHNDAQTPSHFIALNVSGHVEVIEFPGGDATKAKIYLGPTLFGGNSTLDPVTLTFQDVNGDGKPDMLLHVVDQTIVFLNTGTAFQPRK